MTSTALICEDSQTQATIVARLIEAHGWQTLIRDDIKSAMEVLQAQRVQALFLDIYVGERNSLKHFDRFQMLAGDAATILMTAGSRTVTVDDTLIQARRVGADFILRKPFTDRHIGEILVKIGDGKRRHVLVIDDSRTICQMIKAALEARFFRVSVAPSMEAAFDNIDLAGIDLVLSDVFMPGMGGLQGMRLIRKTWPKVKIVSMSAGIDNKVSSVDALNASRRIGIDGQIGKPFEMDDLNAVIDAVFENTTITQPRSA
ncbi:MAG: response regulator [Asticcacaulis sp.]|nr:response regulator [Asticcacaulis sp.]